MTYSKEELELVRAIAYDPLDKVRRVLEKYPTLKTELLSSCEPLLCHFVRSPSDEVFEFGLKLGLDLNAVGLPPYRGETALETAIDKDNLVRTQRLLELGAAPNVGRPIIGSVSFRKTPELQLALLELLLNHGANINQLFDLFGDHDKSFSVLDWCSNNQVREFLIERGALPSTEIKRLRASGVTDTRPITTAQRQSPKSREESIVELFTSQFGKADPRSIREIVPRELPVAIHAIPASNSCEWLTLFTTGMSEHRMLTPKGSLSRPHAELFMQLPRNWPYRKLNEIEFAWPMAWLRKLARYPKSRGQPLDSPATFVKLPAPHRLAPSLNYSGFMLFAELEISQDSGQPISVYRVVPLFDEELKFQRSEGTPALLRAFHKNKLPLVACNARPNAIGGS